MIKNQYKTNTHKALPYKDRYQRILVMSNMPLNSVYRAVFKANIVMSQSLLQDRFQIRKEQQHITLEKVKMLDKNNQIEAILTGDYSDIYKKIQEIIISIQ